MLVPLSWLRDFAPFDLDPGALGEVFDDLGMVVEAVEHVGEGLDGVVVARVLSVDAIAGADKIRRVVVDAGDDEPTQVVCGAWNFGVGDVVPLARVGAVLPGDFAIARRKMKGVVSDGMLCSGRELAIGDDAAGLLLLPADAVAGVPVKEALGLTSDVVYDLAIEANRPDANCIAGVARDAAARLGLPFSVPGSAPTKSNAEGETFEVWVDDPELCDRFTATVFDAITIAPSPAWVARRLTLAGMRPISNVVDASNYVMLELGQPTHAYDLERLPAASLRARAARPGERVTTLDGVDRVLGDGATPDCVICDGRDTAIGIAGIMGGASSEVHDGTTRIVLEAAHFVPMAVARTSKRLGLRSEASARFERGVDIGGIERCVARFAEILGQSSPGAVRSGSTTDWQAPEALSRRPIRLRTSRVNGLLGTSLGPPEITRLLTGIGFEVAQADGDDLDVIAPSFRPDAIGEVDLIEEVARHHGYANVARSTVRPAQVGALTSHQRGRRQVRSVLVGAGISEAMTSPLLGPGDHARAGLPEDGITAVDPLVREESVLRSSLLPGLLRAVRFNADRRNPDVALFEIGKTWRPSHPSADVLSPGPDAEPGRGLPDEREMMAVVLAGAVSGGERGGAAGAVRVLRRLTAAIGAPAPQMEAVEVPGLHPTRTAEVMVAGASAGWVGEVDPEVVAGWGIDGPVGWLELELPVLLDSRAPTLAGAVSRFPSSDVDLAFVVADDTPAGAVEATLRAAAGDAAEWVRLFDVYRGAGVDAGARSLAFRLRLVALDHTLADDEITSIRTRCIEAVATAHRAVLRG